MIDDRSYISKRYEPISIYASAGGGRLTPAGIVITGS